MEVIVFALEEAGDKSTKKDVSSFFGKIEWQGDALAEQRKLRDE